MNGNEAVQRLQSLNRFKVRQRITPIVNRYEIRSEDGALLALAEQKRMALREKVTFFADEGKRVPVFGFKARNVLDIAGVTDIVDEAGQPIGTFRKDFAASLLRSTWYLETAQLPPARGQERNLVIAVIRRFVFDPLPYHFDFIRSDGAPVLTVEKRFAWGRDTYDVAVHEPALDRRVAAAMAVALDALQSR